MFHVAQSFWLELCCGTFRDRLAALWFLWGCVLVLVMVSLALRHYGFRDFLRRCFSDLRRDCSSLIEWRFDHQFHFAQRWSIWFIVLGSSNLLIAAVGAAARTHQDCVPALTWLAITIFVLAVFSPFAMYVDGHLEPAYLDHLAEGHPLLAWLFRNKSSGSMPPPSSYRRRCKRLFCLLR